MDADSETTSSFQHIHLPQARTYQGVPCFPLCLSPAHGSLHLSQDPEIVTNLFRKNRSYIHELLRQHGVLLFRGFAADVTTAEDFAKFVQDGLGLENFPYVGGNAVRTAVVGDRVFTANESPPDKPIPFHHELAQTPVFPSRLLFFCEKPADAGGETPILLSSQVYEELKQSYPQFLSKVEQHGVIYSRVMTAHDRPSSAIGRGWKGTFKAKNRAEAQAVLAAKGYSWEWIGDGEDAMLREISPVLDAVKEGDNGKKCFFNQLFAVWGGWRDELNQPQDCIRAGDGSILDKDAMDATGEIMRRNAVAIPWQRGDIMYIDNLQAQHSRATFVGKRRVLASLAK